eukprot:XP_001695557.1 predicted protein [Chlamydomonas reinhardtii]
MSGAAESARLLLKYGARADLKDNDGCTALQMSQYNPEIQKLIYRAKEKVPDTDVRSCAGCGKTGNKLSSCAGCRSNTYYCGRDCQVAHWPKHKTACKAARKAAAAAAASGSAAPAAAAAAAAAAAGARSGSGAAKASAKPAKPLPKTLRVPVLLGEECLYLQSLQAPMANMMSQAAGLGNIILSTAMLAVPNW